MMKTILSILCAIAYVFVLGSCLPAVYIYERPSVMEETASGEYPVLYEKMAKKSEAKGPMMLSPDKLKGEGALKSEKDRNRQKISSIINGEYSLVEGGKTVQSGK